MFAVSLITFLPIFPHEYDGKAFSKFSLILGFHEKSIYLVSVFVPLGNAFYV